jgi:hypothetical protein
MKQSDTRLLPRHFLGITREITINVSQNFLVGFEPGAPQKQYKYSATQTNLFGIDIKISNEII